MPKKYGVREFNRDASELMISLENQENTYTTKLGAVKNFILKLTVILVNSRQLGRDMGGIKKLRTKVIKLNAKIRKLDEKMNQFENKDEFEEIISSGPNMDLEKKKAREYRKFRILHESKAKDLLEKQGYELKIDEWANKESEDKEFRYIYNGLFGTNGKKELVKGPDRVFELILNINDAKKYISRTNGCIKEIIECCDELIKEPSNIERIAILEGNFNSMITLLNRYDKGSHNKIFLRVRVRMRVVRIAIVTFNKVAPLLEDMRSHFIRLEAEKRQEAELNQRKFEKIYYDLNEQLKLSKLKIDEDVLALQNLVKRYARSFEDIPDLDGKKQEMETKINLYEEQKSILQTIINCCNKIQNAYKSKNKKQASQEIERLKSLLNDWLKIHPNFYMMYSSCKCLENLSSTNIDESRKKINSVYGTFQGMIDDIHFGIETTKTNIKTLGEESEKREEGEKGIADLLNQIGNEIKKLKDLTDGVSQQNIEGELAKSRDEIFSINSLLDTIENCNENNIVNKANFIIEKWKGIDGKLDELDRELNEIGVKPNLEIEGNGPEGMATNHGFKEKRVPQQSIKMAENPIQFADIIKQNLEDLYNLLGALKSYDNGLIQEIKHKRDEVVKNISAYSQWADNNGGYDKNPELLSLTCSQGEKIENKFKEARDVFANMLSEIKIEESLFKLNEEVVLMSEQGLNMHSLLYSVGKALNENSKDVVQNLNKYVIALEVIEENTKITVLSNFKMERQPARFQIKGKETFLYYIPNLTLENAVECIARPGDKIWVKLNINLKKLPGLISLGWSAGKGLVSKYFRYGLEEEENSIVNDVLLVKYGKDYQDFKKSVLAKVLTYELKEIIPKINNGEDIDGITITEVGIGPDPN